MNNNTNFPAWTLVLVFVILICTVIDTEPKEPIIEKSKAEKGVGCSEDSFVITFLIMAFVVMIPGIYVFWLIWSRSYDKKEKGRMNGK